ncbi:efflux RND transporter periplasmic adaptor subunit [Thiomicrorhabdus xiamenensis]|uniref:Efflux RND transporter periplasmic adaptor subunit n=1 Tax=Thiomicrorhabdus xiamenensis TaxID=2739063 RepID=A0A7D4NS37_9GAMM|nr:efflux RND transporter periplasmic adaptor subunit [Thiomicrorhabdus xiamenensis]QKI90110.1 efflux RND transporter periplasmic adaptor subunit [Thiomicrorhabdus xiamenensis]
MTVHHIIKAKGLGLSLAFVSLLAGHSALAQTPLSLNAQQWQAMGVQTAEAEKSAMVPSILFQAEAMMPLKEVQNYSSPVSGKIVRLNKVHGQVVKGEEIAMLDSAELAAIQSELIGISAELNLAYQSLKRTKQLHNSGVASAKQLQQAQAEVSRLQAAKVQRVEALKLIGFAADKIERLLSTNKVQGTQLPIVSPIDGALFEVAVRLNERVEQNQKLFALGPVNPIMLNVLVPVEFVAKLNEGMPVSVEGYSQIGEIHHIEQMVDPLTQKVEVHVLMDNSAAKILPGQALQVRFMLPGQQTFRAPRNAVAQLDGQAVVFLQTAENQVESLPIEIRQIDGDYLYFSSKKSDVLTAPKVVSHGTTAIKLAFLSQSDEEQGE